MTRTQIIVRRFGERLVMRFPGLANSPTGRRAINYVKRHFRIGVESVGVTARGLDESHRGSDRQRLVLNLLADRKNVLRRNSGSRTDSQVNEVAPIRGGDFSIVLCCAFQDRHVCIRLLAEEIIATSDRIGLILCGSTEDDARLIEHLSSKSPQIGGVTCENTPLGRKWQTCVDVARRTSHAEAYGIIGSDDIPSAKLLRLIEGRVKEPMGNQRQAGLHAPMEWMAWDVGGQSETAPGLYKLNYCLDSQSQPLGAGRFYSRDALDECDWLLFDVKKSRNLDDMGFAQILHQGSSVQFYSVSEGPLVSLKGDWAQLNSLSMIFEATTVDAQEFSFAGANLIRESFASEAMQRLLRTGRVD